MSYLSYYHTFVQTHWQAYKRLPADASTYDIAPSSTCLQSTVQIPFTKLYEYKSECPCLLGCVWFSVFFPMHNPGVNLKFSDINDYCSKLCPILSVLDVRKTEAWRTRSFPLTI